MSKHLENTVAEGISGFVQATTHAASSAYTLVSAYSVFADLMDHLDIAVWIILNDGRSVANSVARRIAGIPDDDTTPLSEIEFKTWEGDRLVSPSEWPGVKLLRGESWEGNGTVYTVQSPWRTAQMQIIDARPVYLDGALMGSWLIYKEYPGGDEQQLDTGGRVRIVSGVGEAIQGH